MAQTSSYILNNTLATNIQCYAGFNSTNRLNDASREIVIESPKYYESLEKTLEYIEDLKLMGFNYNEVTIEKDRILINCTGMDRLRSIAFTMAVRYLWEGAYTKTEDNFYLVVKYYFIIKEMFPEYNKFEMLCMACNRALLELTTYYNSNHYFCFISGCKLVDSADKITGETVNAFFSSNKGVKGSTFSKLIPSDWTKEKYLEFYNYLK